MKVHQRNAGIDETYKARIVDPDKRALNSQYPILYKTLCQAQQIVNL